MYKNFSGMRNLCRLYRSLMLFWKYKQCESSLTIPDKTAPQGQFYQAPDCLHACENLSASSAFDIDLFQSPYMIFFVIYKTSLTSCTLVLRLAPVLESMYQCVVSNTCS